MNRPREQIAADEGEEIPDIADKNIQIQHVTVKKAKPMTIKLGMISFKKPNVAGEESGPSGPIVMGADGPIEDVDLLKGGQKNGAGRWGAGGPEGEQLGPGEKMQFTNVSELN